MPQNNEVYSSSYVKHHLTISSLSAILKWRDHCATDQLRNHANRRNIRVRQIRHLRDRLNPLEEYHDELRLLIAFSPNKGFDQ